MKKSIFYISSFSLIFISLDLFTKYLAKGLINAPIGIIDNFFLLSYTQNTGIAFSIALPLPIILLFNIFLFVALIFFAFKELKIEKFSTRIFLALIIGGGLGNFIDRLYHGYVIDFISISIYPLFNLADIFITIGVFSILIFYGKIKRTKIKKQNGSGKTNRSR